MNFLVAENAEIKQGLNVASEHGDATPNRNRPMKTTITNKFHAYSATIRTSDMPAISTLKKHLRKAKPTDCGSITEIHIDGIRYWIGDIGRGEQLIQG
jgi:hypothetical protein